MNNIDIVQNNPIVYEQKVFNICCDIGEMLLQNGAETFRVEETVERVGISAGIIIICNSTLTAITISIRDSGKTILLKPDLKGYNLKKIDQLNTLSRNFENKVLSIDELYQEVNNVKTSNEKFSIQLRILSAGLVGMAPMFVFKAYWTDLIISFFLGIIGYLIYNKLNNFESIPYLGEVFGGFSVSAISILLVKLGLGNNEHYIIISAIMPLVPGVAITNSLRELIENDIISGVARLVSAFLVAGAIGFGILLAIELI